MKTQAQKKNERLFKIVESQQGYFTSKQAEEAGFLTTNVTYHTKTGAWIREERGIYRLKTYPSSHNTEPQLVLYSLWSRDRKDQPQGIYSHETALRIYELTDVMPSKLHMTVPVSFRKSAKTPKALRLYFENIPANDTENKQGFKVTKPLRTILDLIKTEETSMEFVKQAFQEAIKRGLIPISELRSPKIPHHVTKWFKAWMKETA